MKTIDNTGSKLNSWGTLKIPSSKNIPKNWILPNRDSTIFGLHHPPVVFDISKLVKPQSLADGTTKSGHEA